MQDEDATRRVDLLRGIPTSASPSKSRESGGIGESEEGSKPHHKRRRIAGEDETDREIRFAKEDAALIDARALLLTRHVVEDSLRDQRGHINLIPVEAGGHGGKNTDAEAEKAKTKREYEDQYTLRFSNAAGPQKSMETPWYSSTSRYEPGPGSARNQNVWGNEDARRQEREKRRLDTSDPLAAIKKGVTQLRVAEKHRQDWLQEREDDMRQLDEGAGKTSQCQGGEKLDDESSLGGFKLDSNGQHQSRRHLRARHNHRNRRSPRSHMHEHKHRRRHPHRRPNLEKTGTDRMHPAHDR